MQNVNRKRCTYVKKIGICFLQNSKHFARMGACTSRAPSLHLQSPWKRVERVVLPLIVYRYPLGCYSTYYVAIPMLRSFLLWHCTEPCALDFNILQLIHEHRHDVVTLFLLVYTIYHDFNKFVLIYHGDFNLENSCC